jgi:hypothetical protein
MVQTSSPTKKSPSIMDGVRMIIVFVVKSIKRVGMNAYPPITNWVCMGLHAANFNVDLNQNSNIIGV